MSPNGSLMKNSLSLLRSAALSYSEVFFLKSVYSGVFILIITLLNPNLGISGLISILTSFAFAMFVGYEKEFLKSGYYTYNALLVGLSIGQLFTISPLSITYICIASVITFLVTISISDIFWKYLGLPILSLPFVTVTSLIYLSAAKFSNLYVRELYATGHIEFLSTIFPYWINGLLRSFGAILFMPSSVIGLLLLLMIFIQSRILFILAIAGYYFGVLLQGLFIGSFVTVFNDLNAFNYPLIAMALGGIFNIPSIRSYIFAFISVSMATVLIKAIDIFWAEYGIPVFTFPFILITLGMTYVLSLLKFKYRPTIFKDTPEETTEYYYTQQQRYAQHAAMYLPFTDKWVVYQGFDSEWTHQGIWKYAYDFIQKNDKGLSYQNEGKFLEDYYCYRKPICSPYRGTVVYTLDTLPDNPIGVVDTINNWGNYVIIQDIRGYYISLCHLACQSIIVKPGDWVETFQQVALCGNSGYSPQPHVHMQYQFSPYLNTTTIPFTFVGVNSYNELHHQIIPGENQSVSTFFINDFYYQVTNFVLDEVLRYRVYESGHFIRTVEFKVKMDIDSTFYLERNSSQLYFGKTNSSFYFYHLKGDDKYLKLVYKAIPSLPLTYVEGTKWKDIVPTKYIGDIKQQIVFNLKSLLGLRTKKNATYHFRSDIQIDGEIQGAIADTVIKTSVTLDPYLKFKTLKFGDISLIAVEQRTDNL